MAKILSERLAGPDDPIDSEPARSYPPHWARRLLKTPAPVSVDPDPKETPSMKKPLTAIALVAGLAATQAAHAQQTYEYPTPELKALVQHDLGSDFARCAAYYGLGTALAKRDWPNLDISAMERAYNMDTTMAVAMLGSEVALASFKLATDEMSRDVEGDTKRMPIVIAKFGPLCQDLLDHPAQRREHWVAIEQAGIASAHK